MTSDSNGASSPNLKDITGQKFGRLTVICREGKNVSWQATWRVRCDCGTVKVVAGISMRNGSVVSCGCYNAEATSARNTTHGMAGTPVHDAWKLMLRRCYNPKYENYSDYGGRAVPIIVVPEWHDFQNFFRDMGPLWRHHLTLERRDVNGNYCKANCRWATVKEQNNNKRNNRRITFDGRNQTMAQWAEEIGVSLQCLKYRLDAKWPLELAFRNDKGPHVNKRPLSKDGAS